MNDQPASSPADDSDDRPELIAAWELYQADKLDEALAAFEKLIQEAPDDAEGYFGRGRCYYDKEEWDLALADFEKAVQLAPEAEKYLWRGKCKCQKTQYDEALPDLDEATRLDPEEADAYYGRGKIFLDREEYQRAIAEFDQAIRLDPDDAMNYGHRAFCYNALEQYQQAVADLDEAIRREPGKAVYYNNRAHALEKLGELDRALADASQAILLAPDDGYKRYYRATLYYELDRFEEALDDLDRAIRLGEKDEQTYMYRGMCHIRLDMHDEVYEDYSEVIRLYPHSNAFWFRGRSLLYLGDLEAAIADLDKALELNSNNLSCYCERADVWELLGETDKALADYDTAIRLDPEKAHVYHLRAHRSRAQLLEGMDRLEEALEEYDAAIRLAPERADLYNARAHLLEALGRDELADADYQQGLKLEAGEEAMPETRTMVQPIVCEHFREVPLDALSITERFFPHRVGAELQRALDQLFSKEESLKHFFVVQRCNSAVSNFAEVYQRDRRNPALASPPQYVEMDIGEEQPVRCLRSGLWLAESGEARYAVLLDTNDYNRIHIQVATLNDEAGNRASRTFFQHLEEVIRKGACYRGKVLSLESREMYSGQSYGLLVHRLKEVAREEVILPRRTLDLIDRNVVHFFRQRQRLAELGMPVKKGLLLYGPPGTGKTHTIHYLARAIPGQTTFLITAEQVGILGDYLELARWFEPSMVVIEDVDLIARERSELRSAGEEALLNKLLNEMDGLQADSQILFVLTTNRPESLEDALAARPGRIDQAIEFPLPDEECRAKLVRLYAQRLRVPDDVVSLTVARTDKVSASFIKELMRRAAQFHLERDGNGSLDAQDVESAVDELLVSGGSLNRRLLGAARLGSGTGT